MWNGYLRLFATNTYLDNDAENQSLLSAKIMCRPSERGNGRITVKTAPSENGPIWSKRPQKLVKSAPHPKNEGQNGHTSKRSHFFFFFFFLVNA